MPARALPNVQKIADEQRAFHTLRMNLSSAICGYLEKDIKHSMLLRIAAVLAT